MVDNNQVESVLNCSASLRKAAIKRYYEKLRNDPVRWAKRIENQQKRREKKEVRERERQQEREAWVKLPKDHPRKTRKPQRTEAAKKAKPKRMTEKLTDGTVAAKYLHMRLADCPKELIDFKREHIRLNRKLRTRIKSL
jgi:hypothetical protein